MWQKFFALVQALRLNQKKSAFNSNMYLVLPNNSTDLICSDKKIEGFPVWQTLYLEI